MRFISRRGVTYASRYFYPNVLLLLLKHLFPQNRYIYINHLYLRSNINVCQIIPYHVLAIAAPLFSKGRAWPMRLYYHVEEFMIFVTHSTTFTKTYLILFFLISTRFPRFFSTLKCLDLDGIFYTFSFLSLIPEGGSFRNFYWFLLISQIIL